MTPTATTTPPHLLPDSSSSPKSLMRNTHRNVHQQMYSSDTSETMCRHINECTPVSATPASGGGHNTVGTDINPSITCIPRSDRLGWNGCTHSHHRMTNERNAQHSAMILFAHTA